MRATNTGNLFLGLGVFVGALAAAGMAIGFEPASMSAEMINLAVYKLTIASALGLVAAGGVILRHARRAEGSSVAEGSARRPSEERQLPREPFAHPPQQSATVEQDAVRRPERRG